MLIILYVLIAVCWGVLGVVMQKKFHPTRSDPRDLVLNFIVNGVIWPISIIWAIICYSFKIGWAKNL